MPVLAGPITGTQTQGSKDSQQQQRATVTACYGFSAIPHQRSPAPNHARCAEKPPSRGLQPGRLDEISRLRPQRGVPWTAARQLSKSHRTCNTWTGVTSADARLALQCAPAAVGQPPPPPPPPLAARLFPAPFSPASGKPTYLCRAGLGWDSRRPEGAAEYTPQLFWRWLFGAEGKLCELVLCPFRGSDVWSTVPEGSPGAGLYSLEEPTMRSR